MGHAAANPYFGHGTFRIAGVLVEWNIKKTCGFIEVQDGSEKRYFAHKSEFQQPPREGSAPPLGAVLNFVVGHDAKSGKERACQIRVDVLQKHHRLQDLSVRVGA